MKGSKRRAIARSGGVPDGEQFDIIKFIEDTLGVKYRGYQDEATFIDSLYTSAKMRNRKLRKLRELTSK